MSIVIPALAAARAGLQASLARIDRAASVITRAGLATSSPTPEPASNVDGAAAPTPHGDPELDVAAAMVDMMMAQRAFAEQLRVMQTIDQTMQDTIRMTGSGGA